MAPARIGHSGKLRARQTAEILAEALRPRDGSAVVPGLGPNDDPAAARTLLETAPAPLLLVGHLPHISSLTSLLLDKAGGEIVAFRPGVLACLSFEPDGWRLLTVLSPDPG